MNVLIWGYFGAGNLGDELILFYTVDYLKNAFKDINIVVPSINPVYTEEFHKVNAIDRFDLELLKEAIKNSHIVIVGGGGLIQDHYSIKLADFFSKGLQSITGYGIVPLLAKMFSKRIIHFAQGIGPLYTDDAFYFTKFFFELGDYISVRDAYSKKLLDMLEVGNVKLIADPILLRKQEFDKFEIRENYNLPKNKKIIIVNLRFWHDKQFLEYYKNQVKDMLSGLDKDYYIVFLPFQQFSKEESDYGIMNELSQNFVNSKILNISQINPIEVERIIGSVDFLIGMRLHSIILAYKYKIPFLAVPYHEKVISSCKEMGAEDRIIETNSDISRLKDRLFNQPLNVVNLQDRIKETKGFLLDALNGENIKLDKTGDVQETAKKMLFDLGRKFYNLREEYEAYKYQKENQLEEVIGEKQRLENQLTLMNEEYEAYKVQKENQLEERINELQRIYESDFWRLASRYYRLRDKSPLLKFLYKVGKKVKRKVRRNRPLYSANINEDQRSSSDKNILEDVRDFLNKYKGNKVYIIYAGVKYTDYEGQRSVRLTQQFASFGRVCVYTYLNWSEADKDMYGEVNQRIFVISRDDFLKFYSGIFSSAKNMGEEVVLFIEYPDFPSISLVIQANSDNFITVYDILDDWQEFYKNGQAPWYSEDAELFLLRNATYRFCVSQALKGKFNNFDIEMVPNGFGPDKLKDAPALNIMKGEITVGYFGYLASARFDWGLIIESAKKKPNWVFHIIGYGMPDGIFLPKNVEFHGKVHPNNLSSYIKNWDVCIIPFKASGLSKSLNPIKIYDYLYFLKSVVVTGMPHLKDYPYTLITDNNPSSFTNAIQNAARLKIKQSVINEFLTDKSWSKRAEKIENIIWGREI